MDEKQSLVGGDRPLPPRKSPSTARRMIKNIAFAMLMAVVSFHLVSRASKLLHNGKSSDGVSIKYPGENIEWKPCGDVDGALLECSSIATPYDHWNKDGSSASKGNKTFTISINRLRGKDGSKNMLVNPGGPGGSGLDFVKRGGKRLRTIIGDDHHIIGFDPRGVGQSPPLAICFPDDKTRKEHDTETPTDVAKENGFAFAYFKSLAQACADTMGEYGKYINTPQTAADMNSILDAVGQDGMIYWGFSYGTTLGQAYANLFPERSERVVIDGVSNQFEWFDGTFDNGSLVDTENVVKGFFSECIKAGDKCALSSLVDNAEDLQNNLTTAIQHLQEDPMSVYLDEKTYGVIRYRSIWYDAIFPATYTPASWYRLAENLADFMIGDGSKALKAYVLGESTERGSIGESNMIISHNDYVTGKDAFPQTRKGIMDAFAAGFNSSKFMGGQWSDTFSRALWTIPNEHNYHPSKNVKTSHPLLILSTTYDPVCPLSSAKVAQQSFKHSRLVEVQGYGHCSIAVQSSCTAKHIRAFLKDGTLPDEKHTKCEVDGPYFIVPLDRAVAASSVAMSEEEELWQAQLELSELLETYRL